ncbi:MAG: diguanylate cyclase [Campylobacteraceae bacterium]|nr:diguanylate cyclase [Campylobacteraceae bacterium]
MTKEILKDLTILYVEDDQYIQENTVITLEMLQINVIKACNGKEGVEKFIQNDNIDLILTDINMPIMNGLDMIEQINTIRRDVPVIVTTAHQEAEFLIKAIEVGVNSYIMKPIDIYKIIDSLIKSFEPIMLKRQLLEKNKELLTINESLELKVKERTKELELLATIDSLTNVNNRRNFFTLSKEVFAFDTANKLYTVMIDIDKFKNLNDTYGHSIGDEVLKMVSKTINEATEEKDVFGRIGGEEFALVFISDTIEKAQEKVNVIRQKIEDLEYNDEPNNRIIQCTISIGIAQKNNDDLSIDTILARADEALYEAKGTGRNKVVAFRA